MTELQELGLLLAIGVVGYVLIVAVKAIIRIWKPDYGTPSGPPPGHDPDDLDAEFVSSEHWFSVEIWPALTPVPLIRSMTDNGQGFLAFVIVGIPLMAVLQRIDTRFKVCVYRGKHRAPAVRLVSVEFFDEESAAERHQIHLLQTWDPEKYLHSRPLSPRAVSRIRRSTR